MKVGDWVTVTDDYTYISELMGRDGEVIAIVEPWSILVKFPGWKGGHGGNNYRGIETGTRDCCWFVEGHLEVNKRRKLKHLYEIHTTRPI